MTRQQYIDEIKIALKKTHDDSEIDDRLVGRWLDSQRALWIKNSINKGDTIEDNIPQTIYNIEMQVVSSSMITAAPQQGRFLVTAKVLPKFIECSNRLLLTSIRMPELDGMEVNTVKREEIRYVGNGVFNKIDVFGFLYNNKYYIKIPEGNFKVGLITHVAVDGVFETPSDLGAYYHMDGTRAYKEEVDNYPISDTNWEYLLGAIMQFKGNQQQMFRKDVENDGRDSTEA